MSDLNNLVIFDSDDFAPDIESNGLSWFFGLKAKHPNFKVTLFTILGRWDKKMLDIVRHIDWIELAAHGHTHLTNDEVVFWTKRRWYDVINEYEKTGLFTKVFKAPNWEMSTLGYHVLKDNQKASD